MYDAVLVGCGGAKLSHPAPARDLYTSTLFRKSRAWAETNGERWYIASAKHGLVRPDWEIAPYDIRLGTGRGAPAIHDWTRTLVADLMAELGALMLLRQPVTVAILAGRTYVEPIRLYLKGSRITVHDPLQGLGIGQRLAWLSREAAA